jgi:hypothetical protein
MLMAFPASEWDVLVVNGLGPFFIMIFQENGSWERLGNVHINTYSEHMRCSSDGEWLQRI